MVDADLRRRWRDLRVDLDAFRAAGPLVGGGANVGRTLERDRLVAALLQLRDELARQAPARAVAFVCARNLSALEFVVSRELETGP